MAYGRGIGGGGGRYKGQAGWTSPFMGFQPPPWFYPPWFFAPPPPPQWGVPSELEYLKTQAEYLEELLEQIRERIRELESEGSD